MSNYSTLKNYTDIINSKKVFTKEDMDNLLKGFKNRLALASTQEWNEADQKIFVEYFKEDKCKNIRGLLDKLQTENYGNDYINEKVVQLSKCVPVNDLIVNLTYYNFDIDYSNILEEFKFDEDYSEKAELFYVPLNAKSANLKKILEGRNLSLFKQWQDTFDEVENNHSILKMLSHYINASHSLEKIEYVLNTKTYSENQENRKELVRDCLNNLKTICLNYSYQKLPNKIDNQILPAFDLLINKFGIEQFYDYCKGCDKRFSAFLEPSLLKNQYGQISNKKMKVL